MSDDSSSSGGKRKFGLFDSRVEHEGVAEEELLAGDWVLAGDDTGSLYEDGTTEVLDGARESAAEDVDEPTDAETSEVTDSEVTDSEPTSSEATDSGAEKSEDSDTEVTEDGETASRPRVDESGESTDQVHAEDKADGDVEADDADEVTDRLAPSEPGDVDADGESGSDGVDSADVVDATETAPTEDDSEATVAHDADGVASVASLKEKRGGAIRLPRAKAKAESTGANQDHAGDDTDGQLDDGEKTAEAPTATVSKLKAVAPPQPVEFEQLDAAFDDDTDDEVHLFDRHRPKLSVAKDITDVEEVEDTAASADTTKDQKNLSRDQNKAGTGSVPDKDGSSDTRAEPGDSDQDEASTSLFDDADKNADALVISDELEHLTEDGDFPTTAPEESETEEPHTATDDQTTVDLDASQDTVEFAEGTEDPEHTSGEDFLSPDGPEPEPVIPPVAPHLDNVVHLRPKQSPEDSVGSDSAGKTAATDKTDGGNKTEGGDRNDDAEADELSESTVTDDATTLESDADEDVDTGRFGPDDSDTDHTGVYGESLEVDSDSENTDETTEADRDVHLGAGWLAFGRGLTKIWAALLVLIFGIAGLVGIIMTVPAPESGTQAQRLPATAHAEEYKAKIAELGIEAPPAVLTVVTRTDGEELTASDREFVQSIPETAQLVERGDVKAPVTPAIISQDKKAALINVPFAANLDNEQNAQAMEDLQKRVVPANDELKVQFAGGPAVQKDIGDTFKGADVTLLLSTLAIVAVLLLLTYRSPILWIFPLVVVAIVDRAASLLAGQVADRFNMVVDGSTLGITNVLVLGAGTNYALLLTSRYREELQLRDNRRAALARAVAGAGPAILASNITVVLALLMLLFAILPGSRTLGLVAGTMLLFTMVCVILLLPAVYALLPRFVFWPFIPRPQKTSDTRRVNTWERIAALVCRKPLAVLVISLTALGLLAAGLSGSKIGLKPTEQFTNKPASVVAAETLSTHFGKGAGGNIQAIVATESAQELADNVKKFKRVKDVAVKELAGENSNWSQLTVTSSAEPGSKESLKTALLVQRRLSSLSTPAIYVGGQEIEEAQYREFAEADRTKIIGLILLVVFIVLVFLLKSLVAPVLLLIATSLSAFAAVGAGVWVSTNILRYPAIDTGVFLFAFLFLIALGIDYTIFLMDRAKQEAQRLSTKTAVVRAVGATGGVITSAGVVLAAVFVVLGVLPLVTLAQLGAIVCIGILLDTFLVRTLVVPAMCAFVGELIWWPQKRALAKR